MKKIFISLICSLLLSQNIYASELSNIIEENDKINFEYEVSREEKDSFIENLEKEINYQDKNYKMLDYDIVEQDYIDTIETNGIKEINFNSNSLEDILSVLPKTINYNENGYIGINNLDYENISVTPIYNGYYEEYIEETKQYFDLIRNDMNFIPKKLEKDGNKLYLVNVNWYKQTSKNTGMFEITDLYRGEALYRGVKKIYNPYTYKVIAKYKGKAEKKITQPLLIKVVYEEVIPQIEEKEESNMALPLTIITTSSIFFVLLLIYSSNRVKVYCNKKYVGRFTINNNILDISKSNTESSNNYLLKFNNRLYKKYRGKSIKVLKGNLSKYCKIINRNIEIKL